MPHIDWMIYLNKVHRSNRTVVFRISYNQSWSCDVLSTETETKSLRKY
jgi:hypothetical protein